MSSDPGLGYLKEERQLGGVMSMAHSGRYWLAQAREGWQAEPASTYVSKSLGWERMFLV